jgi:uncharacterized protein
MRLKSSLCLTAMAVAFAITQTQAAQGQALPFAGQDTKATYLRLLAEISKVPVFDDHGHPGFADDTDVDAMAIPPDSSVPLRLRDDNPELVDAAKALFSYPYIDAAKDHLRWLTERKTALKKSLGNAYFDQMLDRSGIETAVANRVSMPEYLDPARFRWVFFVDNFLFPFNNQELESRNPDLKLNVPLQEKLLRRNLALAHLTQLPADLESYLQFITKVVESDQKAGGVGLKFEVAYFRSLHFDDPSQQQASAVYAKYRSAGVPEADEYRCFQDFVFRYLLREAGRLSLPVQIHTAVGGGDYFSLKEGNVLNLENVLRDPRYDRVKFVLLHGGFPFEREAIWLAARKNVYLDSSLMGIFLYPEEFKKSLRQWLELFPDKIVFGSDAFPLSDALGAEENYWLAIQSARSAVVAALAEMVSSGEISEAQAFTMARAYLHDTAAGIYAVRH